MFQNKSPSTAAMERRYLLVSVLMWLLLFLCQLRTFKLVHKLFQNNNRSLCDRPLSTIGNACVPVPHDITEVSVDCIGLTVGKHFTKSHRMD